MKANYQILIKNLIYIPAMLLLMSGGCKKGWLEEKSDKNLTVPSTITEFQGLLDFPTLMTFGFPFTGEDACDGHYLTDVTFENMSLREAKDAYTWSKTGRHLSAVTGWDRHYFKIMTDNVILDGLKKITPGPLEQKEWKNVKGQALLHRARLFFELAQEYAQPYDPKGNNQSLGIVLRTSSDITIPTRRSTIKETYEQILNDLKEAKDLMPVRPEFLTRGSSSAANALLARVYLSMSDYENAFIAADDCLKQYSELLDYNDVSSDANFIGRYNREVIWHTNFVTNFFMGDFFIEPSWFVLYAVNDLRKTRFFKVNVDQSISFKGTYENSTSNYFNGLATDEVYLTRAECNARLNKTSNALQDLNTLLVKRWDKTVPFVPYVAANADEALQLVLTERKKELIFRGVRWMDLRRLNLDPRFPVTLKRTVLGTEYTLEPNSYKYTFPIPDNIIELTGVEQNPGWK